MDEKKSGIIEMTADLVSAFVGQNALPAAALPDLIRSIHDTLSGIANGDGAAAPPVQAAPAVPIKKSVTPDFLISLESGRKLKSLKRYLRTAYGMTPEDYRAKWGLPRDYPMVAPAYAAARSAFAKKIGLGQSISAAAKAPAARKPRASKAAAKT